MDRLKLVLGTDDGKYLFPGHLGDSRIFRIYILSKDGEVTLEREIENTSPEEKSHGGEEKMKAILSMLGQVDLMVARKLSPNFKKIAATKPIQPVRVVADTVEEALEVLRRNYPMLESLVERRRNGERFEEIPRLLP